MTDASLPWGSDFSIDGSGNLVMVSAAVETNERIIRRLLTNARDPTVPTAGDYIADQKYGAGLGRQIGQVVNSNAIKADISGQLAQETSVLSVQNVTVTSTDLGAVGAVIQYTYTDGTTQSVATPA